MVNLDRLFGGGSACADEDCVTASGGRTELRPTDESVNWVAITIATRLSEAGPQIPYRGTTELPTGVAQ